MQIFSEYTYNYFEHCVNCGCTDFKKLGKGTDKNNHFHKQIVECKNCGLLFANPIADRRSMQLYYSSYGTTHPRALALEDKHIQFAKDITRQFSTAIRPLRFLDIGAASGEILQAFKDQGWEVYGIELSESFLQFATVQRKLQNIHACEIENAPFADDFFNFINFWHVIEHLRDPIVVLKNIYSWLKLGGKVNIGTPNPRPLKVRAASLITNRFDLGMDHTFGFPPKVFEKILKDIGFIILEHKVYNNQDKKYTSVKEEVMKRMGMYKTLQQVIVQKPAS